MIVAAAQSAQSCPSCQSCQSAHLGIVKLNTAAEEVPELVTLAEVPAFQVVVLHTVIVAAAHVAPVLPVSPLSHFNSVLASVSVTVLESSLVKTI